MKKFSLVKKSLAGLLTGALLMVGLPIALAANSVVQNITISPDPFHIQIPTHPDAAKAFISYKWNSGGNASGTVDETIQDQDGNVVYYYGATNGPDARMAMSPGNMEDTNLEWNGKGNTGTYNGQYVPAGTYLFRVKSHVNTPPDTDVSKSFVVATTTAPALSLTAPVPADYYTNSGDLTVEYLLNLNSASQSTVSLKISGPASAPEEYMISELKMAGDSYHYDWNGKMNGQYKEGVYTYTLNGNGSVDGFGVPTNTLTGNFTLHVGSPATATLSNLSATPSNYNPDNGNIALSYSLNNSSGNADVKAAVYTSGDTNNAVASWSLSNQATGNNSISWDGEKSNKRVDNGSYIFKVWGTDGATTITPMQTSFTVSGTTPPAPGATCAGFTDVNANDSDCAAFTYVKKIGAMTGNGDGTLAPEKFLQRDQVAKIVLETFDKYTAGSDYCVNNAPFPDVTKSAWSYQYVCRGVALAIITGYKSGADAGYYRPERSVNRVEFLALLLRTLGENMPGVNSTSYSDVESGAWFAGYAKYSKDNNLFVGSQLHPSNYTTRREVAEIIYKLYQLGKLQ